eukprot:tig00000241_g21022.t1
MKRRTTDDEGEDERAPSSRRRCDEEDGSAAGDVGSSNGDDPRDAGAEEADVERAPRRNTAFTSLPSLRTRRRGMRAEREEREEERDKGESEDPLALQGEPIGAGTGLSGAVALRAASLSRPSSSLPVLPLDRGEGSGSGGGVYGGARALSSRALRPPRTPASRLAASSAGSSGLNEGGPVLMCTPGARRAPRPGGSDAASALEGGPDPSQRGGAPEVSLRRAGAGRGVAVACPPTLLELRALASKAPPGRRPARRPPLTAGRRQVLGGRVGRVEDAAGRALTCNADLLAAGPGAVLYCSE